MRSLISRFLLVGALGLGALSVGSAKAFIGFSLGGDGPSIGFGVGSGWDGGYYGSPYWGRHYYHRDFFPAFGIRVGPRYYNVRDYDSLNAAYDELKKRVDALVEKLEKRERRINRIRDQRDALRARLEKAATEQQKKEVAEQVAAEEQKHKDAQKSLEALKSEVGQAKKNLSDFDAAAKKKLSEESDSEESD
ncbi:TPA: hypothetical protein DDZ86_02460 [Candidatus Dependentiae bacterium]|nr:MAG: hypothetical protein UW09_C0001G0156 [candidate division TM6 bacterium GW2011_GWF2_43_87]HBL98481.1 hypothetical protein [Candidatus Dependentiae bacterium]